MRKKTTADSPYLGSCYRANSYAEREAQAQKKLQRMRPIRLVVGDYPPATGVSLVPPPTDRTMQAFRYFAGDDVEVKSILRDSDISAVPPTAFLSLTDVGGEGPGVIERLTQMVRYGAGTPEERERLQWVFKRFIQLPYRVPIWPQELFAHAMSRDEFVQLIVRTLREWGLYAAVDKNSALVCRQHGLPDIVVEYPQIAPHKAEALPSDLRGFGKFSACPLCSPYIRWLVLSRLCWRTDAPLARAMLDYLAPMNPKHRNIAALPFASSIDRRMYNGVPWLWGVRTYVPMLMPNGRLRELPVNEALLILARRLRYDLTRFWEAHHPKAETFWPKQRSPLAAQFLAWAADHACQETASLDEETAEARIRLMSSTPVGWPWYWMDTEPWRKAIWPVALGRHLQTGCDPDGDDIAHARHLTAMATDVEFGADEDYAETIAVQVAAQAGLPVADLSGEGRRQLAAGLDLFHEAWPPARSARPAATTADALATTQPSDPFADIIGNRRAVYQLRSMVRSAQRRGQALRHILLIGGPGLGKTTLARAVARAMGRERPVMLAGPDVNARVLLECLSQLEEGDVVFIDEIHAARDTAALLSAMTDRQISYKGQTIDLPPFTIIGATTNPAQLPRPLRERFVVIRLQEYSTEELMEIVRRRAEQEGVVIDDRTARYIAQQAMGVPRRALAYYAGGLEMAEDPSRVTAEDVYRYFLVAGIDRWGLDELGRSYLTTLLEHGTLSFNAMCAMLGEDRTEIQDVEGQLLRLGFVHITGRGRELTAKGVEVAQKIVRSKQ